MIAGARQRVAGHPEAQVPARWGRSRRGGRRGGGRGRRGGRRGSAWARCAGSARSAQGVSVVEPGPSRRGRRRLGCARGLQARGQDRVAGHRRRPGRSAAASPGPFACLFAGSRGSSVLLLADVGAGSRRAAAGAVARRGTGRIGVRRHGDPVVEAAGIGGRVLGRGTCGDGRDGDRDRHCARSGGAGGHCAVSLDEVSRPEQPRCGGQRSRAGRGQVAGGRSAEQDRRQDAGQVGVDLGQLEVDRGSNARTRRGARRP